MVTAEPIASVEMQTAPLRFGYDRLGRRNTIKTYLPGTLATSILSASPPPPVSTLSQTYSDLGEPGIESWSGGPLAGQSVTTSWDSFGRRLGVTTSVAGFQAQNVTAYDPAGRPAIITAGSHTATYRYVANSRIRAGVTYRANGTQRLDTQYDFDRLNRLQQVLNQPSAAGQPAERHAYTYNAAQQRIRDELADGSSWSWEYDRLGQVIGGRKSWPDGNPVAGEWLADGLWTYTWDAENRLISMQSQSLVPAAGRRKLDFEYDPLGRRIGRIVSTGASGIWVPTSTTRWLYEGWNPVAELNGAGTLVREYVWGTDLSGGWQGAGGVGGLLWVLEAPTVANAAHYAAYDGNGNVMGLIKGTDGSWSARYEYGPFGEVVRATGTMAATNPFRWSTKIQDEDSGLNYYGYRYYSAGVGRWLSADPLLDAGIQVWARSDSQRAIAVPKHQRFAFVANSPTTYIDLFGLIDYQVIQSVWTFGEGGAAAYDREFGGGHAERKLADEEEMKSDLAKLISEVERELRESGLLGSKDTLTLVRATTRQEIKPLCGKADFSFLIAHGRVKAPGGYVVDPISKAYPNIKLPSESDLKKEVNSSTQVGKRMVLKSKGKLVAVCGCNPKSGEHTANQVVEMVKIEIEKIAKSKTEAN